MSQDKQSKAIGSLKNANEKESVTIEGTVVDRSAEPAVNDIAVLDGNYLLYRRLGFMALFVVFVLFGGWAALAPLSSSAVAIGEVTVVSHNRVVQHFEGGIVSEVLVKEGASVQQGEVLIKLLDTQVKSELSSVVSRQYELFGVEARLKSERTFSTELVFPEVLLSLQNNRYVKEHVREILDSQNELFLARRNSLMGELNIYQQKKSAFKEQIVGLKSLVRSLDARIISFESELTDWEALYKEQFSDKIRLEELKRSLATLEGERSSTRSEIARLKLQITEIASQSLLRKKQFTEEVVSELRRVQSEKIDLEARRLALSDRLQRMDIVSSIDGIVNGLSIFTIGEVVKPGVTLMEIVPSVREYAVKAKVAITDIDKVYVGLLSDVRFSAFNAQVTQVVEGEVYHVSADKFYDDKTGVEYFEAKVRITESGLKQMEEDGLFLLPGMPAEVMIRTGERTLLGYFVKPFSNMFVRAFNEE
ncbi:hypothetical protein MNBD_GAMMA04-1041 [hydrothermal vent metagenome]|uniref:Membrane fusion protein (MFP) family protein n=1 Tax=hydrothermal vent metagenome TaxID=652676 RepID=A0A3B0WL55_9ZZZZ